MEKSRHKPTFDILSVWVVGTGLPDSPLKNLHYHGDRPGRRSLRWLTDRLFSIDNPSVILRMPVSVLTSVSAPLHKGVFREEQAPPQHWLIFSSEDRG